MSPFFALALFALTVSPALAEAPRDVCAQWGEVADHIMAARQHGARKSQIKSVLTDTPQDVRVYYLDLIERAWRMGRVPGGEAQDDVIAWFSAEAEAECREG